MDDDCNGGFSIEKVMFILRVFTCLTDIYCLFIYLQDVFIMDMGTDIFMWIGKGASVEERRRCMNILHVSNHGNKMYEHSTCK